MENSNYLFEISWEICNKVGGIYTVIISKENTINSKFENYYQIGPYVENSKNYFVDKPITPQLKKAKAILEQKGITIHYGTSKYNDKINVILIDYKNYSNNINQIKTDL